MIYHKTSPGNGKLLGLVMVIAGEGCAGLISIPLLIPLDNRFRLVRAGEGGVEELHDDVFELEPGI